MNKNSLGSDWFASFTYGMAQGVYSLADFKKKWIPVFEKEVNDAEQATEDRVCEEFRVGGKE